MSIVVIKLQDLEMAEVKWTSSVQYGRQIHEDKLHQALPTSIPIWNVILPISTNFLLMYF